jgi:hypothetical protein
MLIMDKVLLLNSRACNAKGKDFNPHVASLIQSYTILAYLCPRKQAFRELLRIVHPPAPQTSRHMKKITDYRKLLGVSKTTELKELKTIYRNFMKDCHPDKFSGDEEGKQHAEEKSKTIIEAYHFLVSIAPETLAQALPEYTQTTTNSSITDLQYHQQTLKITFADESVYEYFDVPKNTYVKLINAESQGRFARRHIYNAFAYRKVSKGTPTS